MAILYIKTFKDACNILTRNLDQAESADNVIVCGNGAYAKFHDLFLEWVDGYPYLKNLANLPDFLAVYLFGPPPDWRLFEKKVTIYSKFNGEHWKFGHLPACPFFLEMNLQVDNGEVTLLPHPAAALFSQIFDDQ